MEVYKDVKKEQVRAKYTESNFWCKVEKTDNCWLWTGSCNNKGRATFWNSEKVILASHFMWYLIHGKYPDKNLLHTCDNVKCVHPAHLFEGTQLDNMEDAYKKGRRQRISKEIVACMREQYSVGVTQQNIANEFGLSQTYVGQLISGKRGER